MIQISRLKQQVILAGYQAVSTIRRILPSLIAHLETKAEKKCDALALGIVTVVKATILWLPFTPSDILPHLSRLS